MIQQHPQFGRIRLEEESSAELMRILYEERERCLSEKATSNDEEAKSLLRYRLRAITRVWKETARMMDEQGWERP
jgi:hypothetical protein